MLQRTVRIRILVRAESQRMLLRIPFPRSLLRRIVHAFKVKFCKKGFTEINFSTRKIEDRD
jgi:hypothetical protein